MTPAARYQVGALKLALELASLEGHRPEVARELVGEAFTVAALHCLWAAERGQAPYQTLAELGFTAFAITSWSDALWRLADLWLDEVWPRFQRSSGRGGGGSSDHRSSGAGQRERLLEPAPPLATATTTHLAGGCKVHRSARQYSRFVCNFDCGLNTRPAGTTAGGDLAVKSQVSTPFPRSGGARIHFS